MRTCPECKTQFEDGKNFCPNCGKYLPRPNGSDPVSSADPVAKLLNIDVPNLTESTPSLQKESFSEVFKESLSETQRQSLSSTCERAGGNPSAKEVSWETSYKNVPTSEAKHSAAADAARKIYGAASSNDKSTEPVDLEEIVKREAAVIEKNEVPSVPSFLFSLFLFSIPVVGLIYLVVLALGNTKYPAKTNLARGVLLFWLIICFLISLAFLIAVLGFGFDPMPFAETFWDAVLAVGEIFSTKF